MREYDFSSSEVGNRYRSGLAFRGIAEWLKNDCKDTVEHIVAVIQNLKYNLKYTDIK